MDSENTSPEASQSRLELALQASNEGVWDWQIGEEEIFYSRRILDFFNQRAPAPNIFTATQEHIHPEDRDTFLRRLRSALRRHGAESFSVNCRARFDPAGPWRWLRIRGMVKRDAAGEAVRIAGSMIDISRRKAAEARVAEERFQLRQLIDHIPLQVYFKDTKSRFVLVNNKMAQWNGFTKPSEIVGKHDRDIFAAEHWKEAEADEIHVMTSGEAITAKLEHELREDGTETWVITSKFPWYGSSGNLRGTFGVSNDVTDLVQAEQRTAALAKALAERNQAYEEEVQLAREIQQAFTSAEVPVIANERLRLEINSRYLPVSSLSGDFFQILPISEHKAGFLICDVMGHGVRSALVTAMMRGLLEKQRRSMAEPSQFLAGLNSGLVSIFKKTSLTMFATAFYAVIDLEDSTLHHGCAGHPGAILFQKSGELHMLAQRRSERGPALGLLADARFPETRIAIEPGQRLILFTDGLFEAADAAGLQFTQERLITTIGEHGREPLGTQLSRVVETVLEHAGNHQFEDDVCLMGVEICSARGAS